MKEEPCLGGSPDRLLDPLGTIQVSLVNHRQRVDVRVEVLGEEVIVVLADGVQQPEMSCVSKQVARRKIPRYSRLVNGTVAKASSRDLAQRTRQVRRLLLNRHGVIRVLVAQILHRGRQMTEEEHVLLSDLLRDLDIRTVNRPEQQPAIQTELHVRSPRGLRTSRTDMLADIRGGDEELREADAVVRDEDEVEVVFGVRVLVDDARDVDDEADDELGDVVARGGFAGEDDDARVGLFPLLGRHSLQGEVSL